MCRREPAGCGLSTDARDPIPHNLPPPKPVFFKKPKKKKKEPMPLLLLNIRNTIFLPPKAHSGDPQTRRSSSPDPGDRDDGELLDQFDAHEEDRHREEAIVPLQVPNTTVE